MSRWNSVVKGQINGSENFSRRAELIAKLKLENLDETVMSLVALRSNSPIQMVANLSKGKPNVYILVYVIDAISNSKNEVYSLYLSLLSRLVNHVAFREELNCSSVTGNCLKNHTPRAYAEFLKLTDAVKIFNNPNNNFLDALQAENTELLAQNETLKAENRRLKAEIEELQKNKLKQVGANQEKDRGIMGRANQPLTTRFGEFFKRNDKATQTETGSPTLVDRIRSNGLA